jgi:hypothetical protein
MLALHEECLRILRYPGGACVGCAVKILRDLREQEERQAWAESQQKIHEAAVHEDEAEEASGHGD